MRAAAGAAVSARRVIALMVVRVNMIRLLSSLVRRCRNPLKAPLLPTVRCSTGKPGPAARWPGTYFSASNAARHFSN
jgi:hypothetical protein